MENIESKEVYNLRKINVEPMYENIKEDLDLTNFIYLIFLIIKYGRRIRDGRTC